MSKANILNTDQMRYRDSCQEFFDEKIISDIVRIVKKGKEAVVLCCKAHKQLSCEYVAVKLYRDEKSRNFQQNVIYKSGRVWDARLMRANKNNTEIAKEVDRFAWVNTEFEALWVMHDLELNVPEPYACTSDAVAMSFIGHGDVAAPLLKHVRFDSTRQAERCLDTLIDYIDIMLRNHIVHGDLSPFNILYHNEEPYIIDLPQSVNPGMNQYAWQIFYRDIDVICNFFKRFGVKCEAEELAVRLWKPIYGPVSYATRVL